MGRLTHVGAIVMLCLSASGRQPGLQVQTDAATNDGFARVSFNDQTISDADREALIRLVVATTEPRVWLIEPVQAGDSVLKIIERVYNIVPDAVGAHEAKPALPRSTLALLEAISHENQLKDFRIVAGDTLRCPPFPRRGDTAFRIFVPALDDVIVKGTPVGTSAGARPPWTLYSRTSMITPAEGKVFAGVKLYAVEENSPRYDAFMTMTHRDASLDALVQTKLQETPNPIKTLLIPAAALAKSAGAVTRVHAFASPPTGFVNLELLRGDQRDCGSVARWIDGSAYAARARRRLAAAHNTLVTHAADDHLKIVDFDFSGGHGGEVMSAARGVLRALDPSLDSDLSRFIDPVELNPTTQKERLEALLDKYYEFANPFGMSYSDVGIGDAWARLARPVVGESVTQIPAVVVQAQLWDLVRANAWFNASWRIETSPIGIVPAAFGTYAPASRGLALVAAGNDTGPFKPLEPQREPQSFPNWMNVTAATLAGDVTASATRSPGGGVDVAAPGCGYDYGGLSLEVWGSSLASPYVAVGAWLEHLLDGTDGAATRTAVSLASRFVPERSVAVDADGLFDIMKLLAGVGPHLTDGTHITDLQAFRFEAPGCTPIAFPATPARHGSLTVRALDSGGAPHLILRQAAKTQSGIAVSSDCTVDLAHASFVFTPVGGASETWTMTKFLDQFREVVF